MQVMKIFSLRIRSWACSVSQKEELQIPDALALFHVNSEPAYSVAVNGILNHIIYEERKLLSRSAE